MSAASSSGAVDPVVAVPADLDVPDRFIGPVTFRLAGWLAACAAGTALAALSWPAPLAVTGGLLLISVGLVGGFGRVGGRPLSWWAGPAWSYLRRRDRRGPRTAPTVPAPTAGVPVDPDRSAGWADPPVTVRRPAGAADTPVPPTDAPTQVAHATGRTADGRPARRLLAGLLVVALTAGAAVGVRAWRGGRDTPAPRPPAAAPTPGTSCPAAAPAPPDDTVTGGGCDPFVFVVPYDPLPGVGPGAGGSDGTGGLAPCCPLPTDQAGAAQAYAEYLAGLCDLC